jgi:hypothetical protein
MMKGLLVLLAVGALFAYFVFNFVGEIEGDEGTQLFSSDQGEESKYGRYYKTDPAGNRVLHLGGIPMGKAREIWKESSIRAQVLGFFPRFEHMRDLIRLHISPSPLREALLKKIDDVESDYFTGNINSDEARRRLMEF